MILMIEEKEMDIRDIEAQMNYLLKNITEINIKQNMLMNKMTELQQTLDKTKQAYLDLNNQAGAYRCELLKLSQLYKQKMTI